MNQILRRDAQQIAEAAIAAVKPNEEVWRALKNVTLGQRVFLVAVAKAAWQMAAAAVAHLEQPIHRGIVVTKYSHVMGQNPGCVCYEAGHPVPDGTSFGATEGVLDMPKGLTESDTVLFLLSGGGSALFEKPLVTPEVLQDVPRK